MRTRSSIRFRLASTSSTTPTSSRITLWYIITLSSTIMILPHLTYGFLPIRSPTRLAKRLSSSPERYGIFKVPSFEHQSESSMRKHTTTTAPSATSSSHLWSQASRLDGLDRPTVWHEFSPLAVEHQSINLGQGFPDWQPPEFCLRALQKSINDNQANQYARSQAHLSLANVLAEEYSERFDRDVNPATQIATATGCTNVLYCALQGLIDKGDEVVLLEPAFDIYSSQVQMAGGTCVYCPLRPSESDGNDQTASSASRAFQLDLNELEACINSKTKVLILNTPHNPTGKIFSKKELEGISKIVQKHPQLTIISDEVYEHIVFDTTKEPHISIATIPGMWDQTLTISSSGKTFSCTGWKVGWAVGPPHLVAVVAAVQQWVNFSAVTPTQDAIAQALLQARQPIRDLIRIMIMWQRSIDENETCWLRL